MYRSLSSSLLLAALLLSMAGCQQSDPEATTSSELAPAPAVPVARAEPVIHEAKIERSSKIRQLMADYVVPFPGRTDMFEPPKDAPRQASTMSDGSVQLRGLVDVGEPQAILDIEGAIAIVPVGREKYGVKVVSIDKQKVTLQRGQTTWTASLD